MIALVCVLSVLGLGNCLEQLPTRHEIESSINRTIDEVERMVRENPNLPRLSRTQIVDILHNITSNDMDSLTNHVEKTREQYERALSVVMPKNSEDSKNDGSKNVRQESVPDFSNVQRAITETPKTTVKTLNDLISTRTKTSEHSTGESDNHWKNHRHSYAEVGTVPPTVEALHKLLNSDRQQNPAPERFTFDLKRFETPKKSFLTNSSKSTATTPTKSNLEIVYSTSVTQRSTTKIANTTRVELQSFRPTMPPTVSSQNVLTFDQWRYNAPPPTTTRKPRRPSTAVTKHDKKLTDVHFLPTVITRSDEGARDSPKISQKPTSSGSSDPQKNKGSPWDMENLRIMNENEEPMSVFVTPMSSTASGKLGRFVGNGNKTPDTTKIPMYMREEVKGLLASIGLRPETDANNDETKNKVSNNQDEIFGTNFRIPESNNVPIGQTSGLGASGVEFASISNQNTFEKTPQDVKQGVNNLSPDVQLLFQRFGLQGSTKHGDNQKIPTTTRKPRPVTVKTNFWNNFKPLPSLEVKDEGMKDFLARFGLGMTETRNEKAMKTKKKVEEKSPSLLDAVPANMKTILENIGLIARSRPPTSTSNPQTELGTTETPGLHIFKPHETSIDDVKQRTKINELLDTVKMVQEGKADVLAVQKAANELLETTRGLKNGPDPLSLEEILKAYNDNVKNEIKRQQNPKELAEMATSENLDSSSTTTTTTTPSNVSSSDVESSLDGPAISLDSSAASSDTAAASAESGDSSTGAKNFGAGIEAATTENSNLAALADSFGGSTTAPEPVLPPRKKSGLYFLVDWNTFLEVGEEGMNNVNLRFQPKVGDGTRFLPVTVP